MYTIEDIQETSLSQTAPPIDAYKIIGILNSLQKQVDGLKGKADSLRIAPPQNLSTNIYSGLGKEPTPEDWGDRLARTFWAVKDLQNPVPELHKVVADILAHEKEKARKEERAKVLEEVRKWSEGLFFCSGVG